MVECLSHISINFYTAAHAIILLVPFQKIVSDYYEQYTYNHLIDDLKSAKEVGDEFTLLLACKWLRRNITVITSKKDWSAYVNCAPDIVITYKGQDWAGHGKWTGTQPIGRSANTRSKSSSEYHTNALHSH